ncbi:MAG: porin family protein, partial [Micropepsaceae bacterium]
MRIQFTLLAGVAAAALSLPAQAGHFNGWYVGLEGGANWIDSEDAAYLLTFNGNAAQSDTAEAAFDTGWAVLATGGYAFDSDWRVEAEFGYRRNDVSARWLVSDTARTLNGDVSEYSLMANVLYDIQLGERMSLSLGAGAGGDHAKLEGRFTIPSVTSPDPISDSEWNFAAQGIAGLSYAISPRLELALNYRYLHVFDPAFSDPGSVSVFSADEFVSFDKFSKHSVTV